MTTDEEGVRVPCNYRDCVEGAVISEEIAHVIRVYGGECDGEAIGVPLLGWLFFLRLRDDTAIEGWCPIHAKELLAHVANRDVFVPLPDKEFS